MVLYVEEDVRVGAEGDTYGAVAKVFLRRSWVSSPSKEQCGAGVAEIVEADVAQANMKLRWFMLDASRSLPISVANMNPDHSAGYLR